MPFLYTFSGMLIALLLWVVLVAAGGGDQRSTLALLSHWLSPERATGWIFFGALCVPCSWLMYRLLRLWFPDVG